MRSDRVMLSIRAGWLREAAGIAAASCCLFALSLAAQQPPAQPAPAAAAEYVGSEVCQTCHEDIFQAFAKNPHQAIGAQKKFDREGQACEACHGPASKHVESASAEDIRNPAKLRAGESDRACLACHLNQPTHAGRLQSGHAQGQVTCSACHRIHGSPGALRPRKPAQVNAQCSECHVSAWAQFQRPHAHRLPQGAMSCIDCHNPHGGFRPQQLRTFAANEPGCLRCHTDKRGPFAFEHAPMRLEGCGACHEAHGSANPRMLTRADVRFVCLECHANIGTGLASTQGPLLGNVPPAFHDLRSARFRNCTICHQKIHGSHVDRSLLR